MSAEEQSMSLKERTLTTIYFKKPDTVPIGLYEILVGAKLVGKPFGEVFIDGKLLAKSRLLFYEEFGQDIIDIGTGIATEAEACGCEVEYPDNAAPWIKKPILYDLKDVSNLKVPDPYKSRSMYANIEAVSILSKRVGEEVFIIGEADQGPFSLAGELRGMAKFYMDLISDENHKFIHELLEYTSNVFKTYARAISKAGADAVGMGESSAGPDLISPEYYRKFAKPYEKKIIEELKKEDILVAHHMCGNVDKIIDDFIDAGAPMIEIDEKTNLKLAKEKVRNKTTIIGSVSPITITFGSKKEIEVEIIKNLEICMPNYGYVLTPGCVIGANTPIKNIKSFIEYGRKHGKY